MKRVRILLAVAAAVMLTACGGDDFTYSSYHCNLTIDNSKHLDQTLNSAMNASAPGTFCKITYKISSGARYFVFQNNQGANSESIFNAIDERLESQNHVGMNNGVIIGYGNMGTGSGLYAFDAQCPNCFDYDAIPMRSYPLTMTNTGMATCASCKRQYNMNTGGNCTNNTGRGLTTYRASTSGVNGILHVY